MAAVWLLTLCLLALASPAAAGEPVSLPYREPRRVQVAGATAAFALDGECVEASAADGIVTLFGRQPCSTHVVVVTLAGTEELAVRVAEAPVRLPPGFVPPAGRDGFTEQGTYEARYSSAPAVVQNIVNLAQRQGDRATQLHVNLAAGVGGAQDLAAVSVPTAFYTVSTPGGSLTLLDAAVTESPLTVDGTLLRGIHAERGPWRVHAGYTAVASFEHVFLPELRESAAGLSYTRRLSPRLALVPSLYFFAPSDAVAPHGLAGTLRLDAQPAPGTRARAEVGVSRGLGLAVDLEHDRGTSRVRARASCKPEDYASLAANAPGGCLADAGWNRGGTRLSLDASASYSRYSQPLFAHTNGLASTVASWRVAPQWTVTAGVTASMFESRRPTPLRYEQLGLPIGIDFGAGAFGAGLRYQPSLGSGSTASGDLWRVSGRLSRGALSVSAFAERQVRALRTGDAVSAVPGLADAIARLGLAATSPQSVSTLLRDTAVLAALGYATPPSLDITPTRTTVWAAAHWTSARVLAPRVSVSSLVMRNDEVRGRETSAIHSASLTQRLGAGWEGSVSWSLVRHGGGRGPASTNPLWLLSVRPGGIPVPGLLFPARTGSIAGTVVRAGGAAPEAAAGLAGVEVVLDGLQTTRTDRAGRFVFPRVAEGRHLVEVRFASREPFYFTSASRVEAETGRPVEFAIGFSPGRVIGYVRNDAGAPLAGVRVRVSGTATTQPAETDGQGRFEVAALSPGRYRVEIEAESLPPGHALDGLGPVDVLAMAEAPGRADLVVPAHRTVAGHVRAFDAATGTYRPAAARTVRLRELDRTCRTDATGAFVFRGLPAGEFTVEAEHDGPGAVRTVRLGEAPAFVRDLDINLPAGR